MPVTDRQPVAPAASRDVAPTTKPTAPRSHPPAAVVPPDETATRNVPFADAPGVQPVQASTAKPLSKTIAVLSVVAVLLAAGVGGLVLSQLRRSVPAIAMTDGGAPIATRKALEVTEMPPPFDAANAADGDDTTYWGIQPAADGTRIEGTSYVITLTEDQRIVSVGISNGSSTELGRVSGVIWGTSIDDLDAGGVVSQTIPNAPGDHTIGFGTTTSQIVMAITGVHDEAPNAGIAEILIEVEETSTS